MSKNPYGFGRRTCGQSKNSVLLLLRGRRGLKNPDEEKGSGQLSFDFLKTLSILQPDAPLRNFSLPQNSIIPPGP
jgi:hypothetical protein